MSRGFVPAIALVAVLAGGCHDCTEDARIVELMRLAKLNYDNRKFDIAARLYETVLKDCNDYYDAIVGMANVYREEGNISFRAAEENARNKRMDLARQKFREGENLHRDSDRYLRTALEMRPGDLLPHYYLGLLWYQRATSPLDFPYPVGDEDRRRRDRDEAIREFSLVLEEEQLVHQVHRYVALLYFAAGDPDSAIQHLDRYHEVQQRLHSRIMLRRADTEIDRQRKDQALRAVEREINEVREVIVVHHGDLLREHDLLKVKEDRGLTPEEKQKLARLNRQILGLEGIIRRFHLTRLAPHEKELQMRCQAYLQSFNGGLVADVMAYLRGQSGEEAKLREAVRRKLSEGTKYRKVRFTSVVVTGEIGKVGFECELATSAGVRPDARITLTWRMYGGQWMVSAHP